MSLTDFDKLERYGYRAKAFLQKNAYIFRASDDEMVIIPLDELQWGRASPEEMRAVIERYFEALAADHQGG